MLDDFGALVARMHRGDAEAIKQFVVAYGDPIRRAARRRIMQLGLENAVEPDYILDVTILELCQTRADIEQIELDELWGYVDRAVQFEATAVWHRRNRSLRATRQRQNATTDTRVSSHTRIDAPPASPPRQVNSLGNVFGRFVLLIHRTFRQVLDLVLRTLG